MILPLQIILIGQLTTKPKDNMTKKYAPRSMPIITRESYSVERSPVMPSWMTEFAKSMEKVSVEPMRNEPTLYDQISSIMGGTSKSKYPTVAAAVEDMKKRTGLAQLINQTVASEKVKKKAGLDIDKSKAYCDGCDRSDAECTCEEGCTCDVHCLLKKKSPSDNKIKLFEENPQIKTAIDNYIETTHGHVVLPATLQHIKSLFSGDVIDESDWKDGAFLNYLKDKILEIQGKFPSNDDNYSDLGKIQQVNDADIDPSNTNALHSLMPASNK